MGDEPELREQEFHNTVREYIIFFLLFIILHVVSYVIFRHYRKKRDDLFSTSDEEEVTVYRIASFICTFSLATSIGAVLLLPFSIFSNEVLRLNPDSFYMKWLNSSLIQGLWNWIFLFSNLSLFIFLPFAYFFTESEGFAGSKKGIISRVYEAFVVLFLLFMLVLGMAYLLAAIIDQGRSSLDQLFNLWSCYLPFLYSVISLSGVVLLLVCTPKGVAHLFSVVGILVSKPQFLGDVNDDYLAAKFEVAVLKHRLRQENGSLSPIHSPIAAQSRKNGSNMNSVAYRQNQLQQAESREQILDRRRRSPRFMRNLHYPFLIIILLVLTTTTLVLVLSNTLLLLFSRKELPQNTKEFVLGVMSLSSLGLFGAVVEVVIIFYFIVTSIVGLYTVPGIASIRPRTTETPLTHIIANCGLVVILSSALPVMSRTLGITNFDLLGNFGKIEWLGNFHIVLFTNLSFIVYSVFSLFTKVTVILKRDIWPRMLKWFTFISSKFRSEDSTPMTPSSPAIVTDKKNT